MARLQSKQHRGSQQQKGLPRRRVRVRVLWLELLLKLDLGLGLGLGLGFFVRVRVRVTVRVRITRFQKYYNIKCSKECTVLCASANTAIIRTGAKAPSP
jgi:hypothetical protein